MSAGGGIRMSILAHSALAGAVIGLVTAVLAVGVATIAVNLLPLPTKLARVLAHRGVVIALACVALCVGSGAVLGWLEGKLKVR